MKICYIKSLYYSKKKGEQLCLKTLDFDNELKNFSMGVYLGNEKCVPKDWIKMNE